MVEYLETVPEKTMEEKEEELKLSLPMPLPQATDSRKKHLSQDSADSDDLCPELSTTPKCEASPSLEKEDKEKLLQQRKAEAQIRRRKKKKTNSSLAATTFKELYHLTGEVLGQGAYASVQTCKDVWTDKEFAVKIIDKVPGHSRSRVFKEIETFHHCKGHKNIIQVSTI